MDKRIIAIAVIIIVIVAAVASWQLLLNQPSTETNVELDPLTLTVVGADGQETVLDENTILDLEAVTVPGGYKTSGGMIALVGDFTGVPMNTVLDSVGGMPSDATLTITASDGYSMVFSYDQVNGIGYNTYDPETGSETSSTGTTTLMVYYLCDDEKVPSDAGPLRIAVVNSDGLLTEGHFWVKFVSKIEVTPDQRDWTVTVSATTDLYMERAAFAADYNHYGITWTDDSNDVWKGTALWRWVSWANYNGGVSNASLDAGYKVEVVAGDGYAAIFDDSEVKDNDGIIVASTINDEILPDPYWPLAIVGEGLSGSQKIKNIVQINILLDEEPGADEGWSIVINGTNAVNMTQSVFEAQADSVSASWTDDDLDEWTGTPLCRIMYWATANDVISSDALVNGSVIKVIAGDGYTVILDSDSIQDNADIFLANKINDEALTGSSYPLKLTGPGLSKKQSVKGVAQIQIMPLSAEMSLTITAANGTEVVLAATDIANLDAYTADGGTRSSSGSIKNIGKYTGVPILTLLDEVGGISSGDSVKIIASDGYEKTISYQEANGGDIATYDSEGNPVEATEPLTMIVAYYVDGTALLAGDGLPGHLRIAVVGPEGVITSGSTWVKAVVALEIIAAGT